MIRVRKAESRGHTLLPWLDSRHSFSFGNYFDPDHMGFGPLRVINEDYIAPGFGFPTHPHKDMEILTYIISGALAHEDSLGSGSIIKPGEIQRMSAGSGISHSEYNANENEATHLLQIWILPKQVDLAPSYEQKRILNTKEMQGLSLIAGPEESDHSVLIHQDARVYESNLDVSQKVDLALSGGRESWLHMVSGVVSVGGHILSAGDGLALTNRENVVAEALEHSVFIYFDLPPSD